MKKLLLLVLLGVLFCGITQAQNISHYRSSKVAIASVSNGYYTWSDWYNSHIDIYIDYTNKRIYIDANKAQRYTITYTGDKQSDGQGGWYRPFRVVDQDGDIGQCRIRIGADNIAQLYIDFNDIAWVYSGLILIN